MDHPSVDDLLSQAGIEHVYPDVSANVTESFLRNLNDLTQDVDDVPLEVIRQRAKQVLGERGFSASRMIDAALKREAVTAKAKADLQGQAIQFKKDTPYHRTVKGSELLDSVVILLKRFVVLPEVAAEALALAVTHTRIFKLFPTCPIIAILSPVMRCAKSLLLEILGMLSLRPVPASHITVAALFRVIEGHSPTLLIDEGDLHLKNNPELRAVLNSGHRKAAAFVYRAVGEDYEPRKFNTYCPKFAAAIGSLPDTLMDRSIVIPMRRKDRSETVERFRRDHIEGESRVLRQKTLRWVQDEDQCLRTADPWMPDELNDRQQDCWRPLIAIADVAGGDWPEIARQAALTLSGNQSEGDDSARVQILIDLHDLFEREDTPTLKSDLITTELAKMEDRPWPEWKSGKPITARQLASLLKPFGIRPKQIRNGLEKVRGYRLEDCEDAFNRYAPPSQSGTHGTNQSQQGFETISDPVQEELCTGYEIDGKPLPH